MANTITSNDLGVDQTNQFGQQNQLGQSGNANQAGQQPQQQSQGNAPTITSSQTANPNKQQGSGYTNIQKVVQANQGNNLGSSIGNNIQQVGSSAQNNLKNAQNQFNQQTQANQFNTDANNQLVQNVLNDPTQAVNQTNGNQFQNLISGQYQGPQGLQNAGQIQSQAANVGQMGQALGTAGGRIGLLQQLVGNNGQYTSGQANLDNLLLGQSNSPELQTAKRQALTLQGQVGSAIQGAAAQGQQNTNSAQQFGQGVRDQFGNVVSSANSDLQKQATQAQENRDQQYQQTLSDLKSGTITQDEANQLGLSQGQNVYNLLNDPSKFLQESALKASAGNVASAQDYAKMQALQKLGGQFAPQNAQQAFGNYQDPTQAGRFANDQAMTGDQSGFQNALSNTQSNYNSIYNPAQQKLQGAQEILALEQKRNLAPRGSPQFLQAEQELQQKYSGALGGDMGAQMGWALANLQTANQNMGNAQNQLNSTYGPLETINIKQPQQSAYPVLQQIPGNLENMPKVQ